MALKSGTRLGPYEIVAMVGSGGMGEVYRARDSRLGRDVAVKVLPPDVADDPGRLRRFEQEARAAAALSHPNVVVVFDVGTADGVSYVVTELLDGETLRSRLDRSRLPVSKAVELASQIASGLAAAHARAIVHRDLKPANIFITREGQAKILDFGLAKITVAPDSDRTLNTEPGAVLGTNGYMSPEQVRGQDADHRADIFALGAILYEMLSGQRAFKGESAADTMTSILKDDPPTLVRVAADIPSALARIVSRCLEKEPAERFQSARDLGFALESISNRPVEERSSSERSIAVLPFTNMSADPDKDYFSDGLSEELISALARLPGLRVASRTSAFRFRGRDQDIREIARQLNVDTVLEGSIRRAGNRLRITAQLVNASDGYHLWSERYDREMADVFDIQDEITASIVKTLEPALLGKQKPVANRHTSNVQAYELYLKGRHFWHQRSSSTLQAGITYFNEAIKLDPRYALAHAGLADSYAVLRVYGLVSQDAKPQAEAAAKRAMEFDPSLAESHFAAALFRYYFTENWPDSEPYFKKAIEIDPRSSMALGYYATFLSARHRFEEARKFVAKSMEADPLSPFAHALAGVTLYTARRYGEAVQMAERAIELHPDFALALYGIGLASIRLGNDQRAIQTLERVISIAGRIPWYVGMLGMAYAASGRRADAHRCLEELADRSKTEYVFPFAAFMIYTVLGDREKVYEQLQALLKDGYPGSAVEMIAGPLLDDLFSDPRCAEIFARLHVVPRTS